jgi:hypothetical protein
MIDMKCIVRDVVAGRGIPVLSTSHRSFYVQRTAPLSLSQLSEG